MKLIEKQQVIILALALIIFAGFGMFRYYPLAKRRSAAQKSNMEHLVKIAETKAYGQQLPIIRQKIDELRIVAGDFDKKIPKDRNFADLWDQIAKVMNRHNLKEQLVQPGNEIKGDELNCIPISIQCTGSLSQIFEFFKSLQKFDRLIRVESVTLTNDSDFTGRIKMNADANVYYQAGTANII